MLGMPAPAIVLSAKVVNDYSMPIKVVARVRNVFNGETSDHVQAVAAGETEKIGPFAESADNVWFNNEIVSVTFVLPEDASCNGTGTKTVEAPFDVESPTRGYVFHITGSENGECFAVRHHAQGVVEN